MAGRKLFIVSSINSGGRIVKRMISMHLMRESGGAGLRRSCILLPPRAKGCRAGARNIPAGGKHAGRGCTPQSKNEKRAVGTPAPAGCATEAARNDPRPGSGIPFLHLTTKAQKIATQGQLFPPRVIVFRQAASKCALTGCLLSAFVCVILGNDSTNRKLKG